MGKRPVVKTELLAWLNVNSWPDRHSSKGLGRWEPQCAAVIVKYLSEVQDFKVMKDYAYTCRQVFSYRRWGLTGEAGVFTDPLYSQGGDFIAISNSLLTDLITRELAGENIRERAEDYNRLYLGITQALLAIYELQYSIMGNAQVMTAKIIWDTAYYWASMGFLFFHQKFYSLGEEPELAANFNNFARLNRRVQAFFREWAALEQPEINDCFVEYYNRLEFMPPLQAAMLAEFSSEELRLKFSEHLGFFERLAGGMAAKIIDWHTLNNPRNSLTAGQLAGWQSDSYLQELLTRYREAQAPPLDLSWVNLAHTIKVEL